VIISAISPAVRRFAFLCGARGVLGACRQQAQVGAGAPAPAPAPAPAADTEARVGEAPAVLPLATFDTAWSIIARSHWDSTYNGVNWTALRDSLRPKAAAASTQQELRQVLQTMVLSLRQSHFAIIPQEVSDVALGEGPSRGEGGEGQIGVAIRWIDGKIVVSHVESDSPAEAAGVRAGWLLERLGDDSIAARVARLPASLDPRRVALSAYSLSEGGLRGAPGTPVTATFVDDRGTERTLTLTRAPARGTSVKFGNLPPQQSYLEWERRMEGGKTIGIIRFNIWMPVLARQFDIAMDSLRQSDGIILDIRGNFGGVAGMAMGFAGHFVDTVIPVGVMKTRVQDMKFAINPRRVNTANQRVTPFAGPLAIVVDELSISTSEVFAGGLQALSRARIIGSQTAGQALPAVAERLPNGDILYHAIADFLSPSGARMEGDGVIPDQPVRLTRDALLEGRDPALDAAVRWAATAPPPGPVTGARVTP
jgi:carboxyl-terminal processing protease